MKIGIAGAGAGKTTAIADTIIQFRSEIEVHKKIFCITFTNNAVKCISGKLQEYYGRIPDNIVVSTIHSFLYQEFVRPYYYLLFGKQYERISVAELPRVPAYRNGAIGRLEDKNVLHQTVIPERARWVVVKKSKDTKEIKEKRNIIKSNFKSYCGAICIDEAQDIDGDMLDIIESLHKLGITILLMGDPKQDLKGHKCLRKLAATYPDTVEYFTLCHRCPQNHLAISNIIVADAEKQYSERENGSVVICFASDKNITELLIEENFDLKFVSQRQSIYETHTLEKSKDIREALCEEISIVMQSNHPNITELACMRASYYLGEKLLHNYRCCKDKQEAMNRTFKMEPLKDNRAYGRIINLIPDERNENENEVVYVNSIDSIKGQEGKNCILILTTDLAAYLLGTKTEETIFKNRLYVGLTRSLEKLTIYITPEVEKKYGKEKIKAFFNDLGCEFFNEL